MATLFDGCDAADQCLVRQALRGPILAAVWTMAATSRRRNHLSLRPSAN